MSATTGRYDDTSTDTLVGMAESIAQDLIAARNAGETPNPHLVEAIARYNDEITRRTQTGQ